VAKRQILLNPQLWKIQLPELKGIACHCIFVSGVSRSGTILNSTDVCLTIRIAPVHHFSFSFEEVSEIWIDVNNEF